MAKQQAASTKRAASANQRATKKASAKPRRSAAKPAVAGQGVKAGKAGKGAKSLAPRRSRTTLVKQGRIQALTKVFAALGAQRPTTWARSHVDGGYDELGRYVLLRALWLRSVEPGRLLGIARNEPDVSAALDRLLKVTSLADLDAVVRFAQKQALYDVCSVLDDPAASDEGIGWAVFRTDGRGLPLWALDRLAAGLTDAEPR